jgi:hypothetical protein
MGRGRTRKAVLHLLAERGPSARYQIRISIAKQGSFGELSELQRESARRLRETFFPGRSEAELELVVERLAVETG